MLPPELILQLVKKLQTLHMTDVPGHISHGQSAVPSALETSVAFFILYLRCQVCPVKYP